MGLGDNCSDNLGKQTTEKGNPQMIPIDLFFIRLRRERHKKLPLGVQYGGDFFVVEGKTNTCLKPSKYTYEMIPFSKWPCC